MAQQMEAWSWDGEKRTIQIYNMLANTQESQILKLKLPTSYLVCIWGSYIAVS